MKTFKCAVCGVESLAPFCGKCWESVKLGFIVEFGEAPNGMIPLEVPECNYGNDTGMRYKNV